MKKSSATAHVIYTVLWIVIAIGVRFAVEFVQGRVGVTLSVADRSDLLSIASMLGWLWVFAVVAALLHAFALVDRIKVRHDRHA